MKKLALVFTLLISLASENADATMFKIFGLEIDYVRGKRELKPDGTVTDCFGKGMCSLIIKADAKPLSAEPMIVNLDGHLALCFPQSVVEEFGEDFTGGMYNVNTNIGLSEDQASAIGLEGPINIRSGRYRVRTDDNFPNHTFVYLN